MSNVMIATDSTCDLSTELINQNDIKIIPLYVTIGDTTGKDGVEITPDQIYKWADANNNTPKTSAFSPEDAADVVREAKQADTELIYIGISEQMSTSCNSMRLAAQSQNYEDKTFVIDSNNLSTGVGLIVLEAVRMSKASMKASDIVNAIDEIIDKTRASFIIDTLTYLHRGGRCSTITALLANTLRLKPKIVVKNGKMGVDSKYRGKLKLAVMNYVKDMEKDLMSARPDRVFITHSGIDSEIVEEVRSYLESLGHFLNITETRAGGVISSHCGPGTLGVLFIDK